MNRHNLLIFSFLFFLLLVINFFFYSLITISIYKILCFDVDYLIFYIYKLQKNLNIFYYYNNITFFNCSSINVYIYTNYNDIIFKNNFFFYIMIPISNINSFFYTNISMIKSNISLFLINNLIYLNFFIRSSNFL